MIRSVAAEGERKVVLAPNTALISITTPGQAVPDHAGWTHVHRLAIRDTDGEPWDYRDGPPVVFTAQHAADIWAFVRGLPGDVIAILVHCDAGISRSSAVAAVIADELGAWNCSLGRFSVPNRLIMEVLRGAL